MKFNKCARCGSFFASDDNVCPSCFSKDEIDRMSLKNYLANNEMPRNVEALSSSSGVNLRNINRFFDSGEFPEVKKSFDKSKKQL